MFVYIYKLSNSKKSSNHNINTVTNFWVWCR